MIVELGNMQVQCKNENQCFVELSNCKNMQWKNLKTNMIKQKQELDAFTICSKLFKCPQDVKLQLINEASSLNLPLLHATIFMCSCKISMFIVELDFNLSPTNP
jgi:hypothetical protein